MCNCCLIQDLLFLPAVIAPFLTISLPFIKRGTAPTLFQPFL